jgi:glycosyltransferase 2 family protein
MRFSRGNRDDQGGRRSWKPILLGGSGIVLGGVFLGLAVRHVDPADVAAALQRLDRGWLIAAVAVYLAAIGLRCLRWGVLLRAADSVKWRHAAEALLTGFAANYVLPGRVGELFRADYARRVFNMSRFTSLGTIVVERVCDGVVLVCMLWGSFAWFVFTRFVPAETWILLLGAVSSIVFSGALVFVLVAQQINLRRFGVPQGLATRWDRLVKGISSVLRGNATTVILYTIGVWTLEVVALASMVRSFGVSLTPPEVLMLLGVASLSTLLPTAPGYVGTYQLVFGHVFRIFGYQQTTGIIAATAIQIFCFGTVTIIGGFVLLSRSGIVVWRANKLAPP